MYDIYIIITSLIYYVYTIYLHMLSDQQYLPLSVQFWNRNCFFINGGLPTIKINKTLLSFLADAFQGILMNC